MTSKICSGPKKFVMRHIAFLPFQKAGDTSLKG